MKVRQNPQYLRKLYRDRRQRYKNADGAKNNSEGTILYPFAKDIVQYSLTTDGFTVS